MNVDVRITYSFDCPICKYDNQSFGPISKGQDVECEDCGELFECNPD